MKSKMPMKNSDKKMPPKKAPMKSAAPKKK
jgi:hypothetical protein